MAQRRRVFQVAEKIRNVVAQELIFHAADPRFSLVTITSVVASSDLRHAKIYWVSSGDAQHRAEIEQAFAGAVGMLRRAVGKELGVKFVPELHFFYDDTLDQTEAIEKLLAKIRVPELQEE